RRRRCSKVSMAWPRRCWSPLTSLLLARDSASRRRADPELRQQLTVNMHAARPFRWTITEPHRCLNDDAYRDIAVLVDRIREVGERSLCRYRAVGLQRVDADPCAVQLCAHGVGDAVERRLGRAIDAIGRAEGAGGERRAVDQPGATR